MTKRRIILLIICVLIDSSNAFSENIYSVITNENERMVKSVLIVEDDNTGKKFKGPEDRYVTIEKIRDINNDGLKDAIVSTSGGGNCCPEEYYVVTLKNGKLEVVKTKSGFSYIKEEDGKVYIVDEKTDDADYYSFDGEKVILSKTVKGIKALKEVHSPGCGFCDESTPPEVLVFDVNEDKKVERIVCNVSTGRSGNLHCKLPLPNGENQNLHRECGRFGVLPSMNNGYHEFVCDFDIIVSFDGKRWVNKTLPQKGDF